MRKTAILLTLTLLVVAPIVAQSTDDVRVMLHQGHEITDFVTTYDERYIITRSDAEICVWDIDNLLLVSTLPVRSKRVYAHPADNRLIYVLKPGSTDYEVIDWINGERTGVVTEKSVPKYFAKSDYSIARFADMLILVSPDGNTVRSIGGFNFNPGSARTDAGDTLLVTSGDEPTVYDLKHASLVGGLPYLSFLNKGKSLGGLLSLVSDREGRRNKDVFFNSYFVPGTDRVILGGANDSITIWRTDVERRQDGALAQRPEVISMGGGGKSPSLSLKDDIMIAAAEGGIYRSQARQTFKELPAFRKAAGGGFKVVTRPFRGDRFLAVGGAGSKGQAVMEGAFTADSPLRIADKRYQDIRDVKISPHDDYAIIALGAEGVARLGLKGDNMRYEATLQANLEEGETVTACEILPDETVVAATSHGTLFFWRKGAREASRHDRIHTGSVNTMTLSSDSTRMFSSDNMGQITIWDTATKEQIVSIYQLGGDGELSYIFITPDHYYKMTPSASSYVNFVKDGRPYIFEQFDLRNNRPDIVLSRLGGDAREIDLLNKAWKKRLRRSGISEESLSADYHVPLATLNNRASLAPDPQTGHFNLDVTFSDTLYPLSEITVTVNGVPVLAPEQRKISGGRTYRLRQPLRLSRGENKITAWCTNTKGASSLRATLQVAYNPPAADRPDLYIVACGVSKYADPNHNLGFASKDATDFVEAIKQNASPAYGQVRKLTLTDRGFTKNSLKKIRDFVASSRPDDVVLLFFAGHGVLDSELDYYLATYDMNFANPADGGIRYDDFLAVFDSAPALNRVCFIDACHSGELDKEDYLAVNTVEMPAGEELVFRAAGHNVSAKEDVARVNTLLSDMFVDTRWGVGATVLSSAGADELAVESPEWKNGLFTYCLLKGLQGKNADADHDGVTTLYEWIKYTQNQVSGISEGRQSPSLRSQNHHSELKIK